MRSTPPSIPGDLAHRRSAVSQMASRSRFAFRMVFWGVRRAELLTGSVQTRQWAVGKRQFPSNYLNHFYRYILQPKGRFLQQTTKSVLLQEFLLLHHLSAIQRPPADPGSDVGDRYFLLASFQDDARAVTRQLQVPSRARSSSSRGHGDQH